MTEIKNGYVISRDTETQEITKREKIGYIYVKMTTNERTIGVYYKFEFLVYDGFDKEIANVQEEIDGCPYPLEKSEVTKDIQDEVSKKYGISRNKVQVEFTSEPQFENT